MCKPDLNLEMFTIYGILSGTKPTYLNFIAMPFQTHLCGAGKGFLDHDLTRQSYGTLPKGLRPIMAPSPKRETT